MISIKFIIGGVYMVDNYIEILYDNEVLESEYIVMRKFKKEDANDVFEYGNDEETVKYLEWNGVKTIEAALKNIVEYYWSKPGIYALELKENKKCIGCI